MLKFESFTTNLCEVPNHVSLIFNLTGCPLRFKGCHSPELRSKTLGEGLTKERFVEILSTQESLISAVCFMGGDVVRNQSDYLELMKICQDKNLKTCIYTGLTETFVPDKIRTQVSYLKTGPYSAKLGGLDKETTNQIFRDMSTGDVLNHLFRRII